MVARETAGQAQVSSDHVPSLLGGLFCTLLPHLCQHSTSFSGKVSLVAPKVMALSPHFPGISPPGCHPPEDLWEMSETEEPQSQAPGKKVKKLAGSRSSTEMQEEKQTPLTAAQREDQLESLRPSTPPGLEPHKIPRSLRTRAMNRVRLWLERVIVLGQGSADFL